MQKQIDFSELPSQLQTLLNNLPLDEEIIFTKEDKPIAKIVRLDGNRKRRQAGTAEGMVLMSPDFNDPLEEFKEYME